MSDPASNAEPPQHASTTGGEYIVVARRYRPQVFDELVGQQHVAQALSGAIQTDRVGHAYLFTGARGVGKTSAARILAKALNCEKGPATVPCNQCDICRSISSGDDVDVLEIDGASNRGIDEIRQLRQNVGVRPSRARLKIYIIDEVHMLTREAFNALLKTLEEPPGHVKFIFCTTEPTKIPVTILSRCQQFDFAGISTSSIAERLRQIVDAEGVDAEDDALVALARRAAGSMRDGQSLLEQLLAFAPGRLTLDHVHGMLGTAGDERLAELVGHLVDRDAAAALADLDAAVAEGVGVAQLLEQLLGYFRDCMLAAVDCPADAFLHTSPAGKDDVVSAGKRLGLQTVLAVMQVLDHTLARMRLSTQGHILTELALVRICCLEDLDELPGLIAQLQSGAAGGGTAPASSAATRPPAGKERSKPPGAPSSAGAQTTSTGRPTIPFEPENAAEIWTQAVGKLSGMVVEHAGQFDRAAISGPNRLVVFFKPEYALQKSFCQRPEAVTRIERALAEVAGQPVRLEFALEEAESEAVRPDVEPVRRNSPHQRLMEVAKHPMIRRASELFDAQPIRVDDPQDQK